LSSSQCLCWSTQFGYFEVHNTRSSRPFHPIVSSNAAQSAHPFRGLCARRATSYHCCCGSRGGRKPHAQATRFALHTGARSRAPPSSPCFRSTFANLFKEMS
jgi:hypothetical protein